MGKISKKLVVICGPTATGKTKLALHLSKLFNGELISADSRQVYKELDIGTGKDHPKDAKIWGIDLVDPKEDFSVSQYQKYAREKIQEVWKRNHLPILVGGTGFYIKAVIDGIDTISIPKDENLRKEFSGKTPEELYEILLLINPNKAIALNNSDKKNPARLTRSIEVAKSALQESKDKPIQADILFIGLKLDKGILNKKIESRVKQRINMGFEKEIDNLLAKGVNRNHQAMNTLGYKQWPDYKEWILQEQKYTKRQLTWFAKDKRINWFDLSENDWQGKLELLVKRWYDK